MRRHPGSSQVRVTESWRDRGGESRGLGGGGAILRLYRGEEQGERGASQGEQGPGNVVYWCESSWLLLVVGRGMGRSPSRSTLPTRFVILIAGAFAARSNGWLL